MAFALKKSTSSATPIRVLHFLLLSYSQLLGSSNNEWPAKLLHHQRFAWLQSGRISRTSKSRATKRRRVVVRLSSAYFLRAAHLVGTGNPCAKSMDGKTQLDALGMSPLIAVPTIDRFVVRLSSSGVNQTRSTIAGPIPDKLDYRVDHWRLSFVSCWVA